MLRSANLLSGAPIQARDGEAGLAESLLFDDERWVVRYVVVDAGSRRVLISPVAIEVPEADHREFRVRVTREQLERCPEFMPEAPLTRDWERGYLRFFAWPLYWGGGYSGLWGPGYYPGLLTAGAVEEAMPDAGVGLSPQQEREAEAAGHLHSTESYVGYSVVTEDGTEVGDVDDFLFDDRTWALAYVAVYKGRMLGRRVLVPVECFDAGSWAASRVTVRLPAETLRTAPEWEPLEAMPAEYERSLHAHYGRPRYLPAERGEEAEGSEESDEEVEEGADAHQTAVR